MGDECEIFFEDLSPGNDPMAFFVASEFPKGKWLLTVDRATWEFGKMTTNILVLAVVCRGVAVPPLWKFLAKKDGPGCGKKGNSDTDERKALIKNFIRLFGKECIGAVVADRESVGNPWSPGPKGNNIGIVIRVRRNRNITNYRGIPTRASHLFRDIGIGEIRILRGLRRIGDAEVHVCGMRLPSGGLPIVATFDAPEKAPEIHVRRWQIGTMFECGRTHSGKKAWIPCQKYFQIRIRLSQTGSSRYERAC